jgi:sulfane dehydrogenase subunit SoxC
VEHRAGNGLLDRRLFLRGALAAAGVTMTTVATGRESRPAWSAAPGHPLSKYGQPSRYESHVGREGISSQLGTMGSGASRTPLQHLKGTLTPASLHFERHHSGIPEIDPELHELHVHGLVKKPLKFSMADLQRYPMTSRTYFLECSGNSAANLAATAPDVTCGQLHGLVSGSEWTGVRVGDLLDEAGIEDRAQWVVAEGADAARMNRSIPMDKMLDDALLALYQNGERLRPEQGYPVRLFLPGYEGNASVKWLRSLQVSAIPAMSRQETSKYTDLRPDGRSEVFTFDMDVKSVITSPSPGLDLKGHGYYEISGLAWTGRGAVQGVDVSADGGKSWAPAQLEGPVLEKALTRFRIPWHWQGAAATLMSRAYDGYGVQPGRDEHLRRSGETSIYHYNAIQAWQVDSRGASSNVFA